MGEGGNGVPVLPGEVFESILAGEAEHSRNGLERLPDDDRQQVLCTLCVVCGEVETNCPERGRQIAGVLGAECKYFVNGVRTCRPLE